ncbi:hypothetical protein Dimus_038230 [Dionaea muscipula]
MVHGPCGNLNPDSPCMVDGQCSKRYPRSFVDATTMDGDGYPIYRRRAGPTYSDERGNMLDNSNVVPYNPHLSRKFNCHINVEVCNALNISISMCTKVMIWLQWFSGGLMRSNSTLTHDISDHLRLPDDYSETLCTKRIHRSCDWLSTYSENIVSFSTPRSIWMLSLPEVRTKEQL